MNGAKCWNQEPNDRFRNKSRITMTSFVSFILSILSQLYLCMSDAIFTTAVHYHHPTISYLTCFWDNSTATLNAPNKAVNWIFSDPPRDNRCLSSASFSLQRLRVLLKKRGTLIQNKCLFRGIKLTRIALDDPVDKSDSDSVILQFGGNRTLQQSYPVMRDLVQS